MIIPSLIFQEEIYFGNRFVRIYKQDNGNFIVRETFHESFQREAPTIRVARSIVKRMLKS